MDVRGAVFTQPHPIVRSDRRMARPECPSALPRRISAVVASRTIAFHFVTCPSRSWLVERLPVDLTLCINERTTNVRREWIASTARLRRGAPEAAEELYRSLTRRRCTVQLSVTIATREFNDGSAFCVRAYEWTLHKHREQKNHIYSQFL